MKWERYRDRDVLPFWVADMDFQAPPAVVDALRARAAHGVFGYTVPPASAITAVLDYLRAEHGIDAPPEWLLWMPGLVPALNTASRAYEKPGDSVLTCTPVYPPFLTAPGWQGKELIAVPLVVADGRYTFDWDGLARAVRPDTRMFILCNPHNPVGRVFDRDELERLLDFCERHDLILVSDEIHCDLIIDPDARHHTVLSFGERARARSLTMMAPSKTFNIPGLSCSFILIPDERLRRGFVHASRGMVTEINCFGYVGCEAAYRHGMGWLAELRRVLRQNRDRFYAVVGEQMPLVRMLPMQATYLAWMDVRPLGLANPHRWFEEHGIGLSDGALFGGPGFLRFNFGCPPKLLEQGIERLLKAYRAAVVRRAADE